MASLSLALVVKGAASHRWDSTDGSYTGPSENVSARGGLGLGLTVAGLAVGEGAPSPGTGRGIQEAMLS